MPSEASDWYSVGVTLYESSTGTTPFAGPLPDLLLPQEDVGSAAAGATSRRTFRTISSDICMGLLCRDPERRLSGRDALRELAGGAGAAVVALAPRRRREPSFVGRERELDMLNGAFLGASHGRAGVVCIHGPSGIGKSALVQCFLDRVLEREDVVSCAAAAMSTSRSRTRRSTASSIA